MVAHEIRTPLAGITGITELLIEGAEGELSKDVVKNLELISGSSKRLTYLLNELLDISRIQEKPARLQSTAGTPAVGRQPCNSPAVQQGQLQRR